MPYSVTFSGPILLPYVAVCSRPPPPSPPPPIPPLPPPLPPTIAAVTPRYVGLDFANAHGTLSKTMTGWIALYTYGSSRRNTFGAQHHTIYHGRNNTGQQQCLFDKKITTTTFIISSIRVHFRRLVKCCVQCFNPQSNTPCLRFERG